MSIIKAVASQEAYLRHKGEYINVAFTIKDVPHVLRLENNYIKNNNEYRNIKIGELLQTIGSNTSNEEAVDLGGIDINALKCGPKLYKYLDEWAAIQNISNGTIRFKEPSKWEDGFEKMFYQADFSQIISSDCAKYTPRFNACCFTYQHETYAAWKMYRSNWNKTKGRVVCFEINEKKLLLELSKYAVEEDSTIYQGYMDYRIEDVDLKELYKKGSKYHDIFFKDFSLLNYLSLMLLKRNAFSYEQETRFFVIPNNKIVNEVLDIPISLKHIVNRIILGPNYTNKKMNEFIKHCRNHGLDCDIVISELSQECPRVIMIES